MLLSDVNRCLNGVIVFVIIMMLCAMYAYYIDSKRPADDPKKKHHHPMAILLAPITFPILLVLSILLFILKVLVYGVFAVLFILALILIRKPFLLEWLRKAAIGIGDRLMEANTLLIRLFLRPLRT
jgi:hypothetical protein